MFITTNAPIIEEQSNAVGKKKAFKKAGEKIKGGFTKFTQAGGLGVIENLLNPQGNMGANMGTTNVLPPPPPEPVKTGMSTTTKVIIGVLVIGAIAGAIYYSKKGKGAKSSK
jgi:hypothetical protein